MTRFFHNRGVAPNPWVEKDAERCASHPSRSADLEIVTAVESSVGHPTEPSGSELQIVVPGAPVSLQSRRGKKSAFSQALQSALGAPQYLLSGEVSIRAEWLVHERIRYETVEAPDVDNTLKVVLDALCGPQGVLINDCQVQHVSCHWIDWTRTEQQFTVTIEHLRDDWVRKEALVFVEAARLLCWPLNLDLPPEVIGMLLTRLQEMIAANQEILDLTGDWCVAKRILPVQQPFHRGRLRGFKIMTVAQVRNELGLA